MLGNTNNDNHEEERDTAGSVAAATHGPRTRVETLVEALDACRYAEGSHRGYTVEVRCGSHTEDAAGITWTVTVTVKTTKQVADGDRPGLKQKSKEEFSDRFSAYSTFEMLAERYDLSETKWSSNGPDGGGGQEDEA